MRASTRWATVERDKPVFRDSAPREVAAPERIKLKRCSGPSAAEGTDETFHGDVVVFPSTWEGFGNPPFEASIHRRPVAIGTYPVAQELLSYGFQWFSASDTRSLVDWLAQPETAVLDRNIAIVREQFNIVDLPAELCKRINEVWG